MEPVSTIANILGQETVRKVYEDGVSKPLQEATKITTDLIKSLRLFTAPIQLLASYQDRLEKYLNQVANEVPADRQIQSPPMIAGPIIEKLKYLEETNYLKDLYLNLLKRSIDSDRINEAHPAFILLIDQLSPDEALIIKTVEEKIVSYTTETDTVIPFGATAKEAILENTFPVAGLNFPQNFELYIRHLLFLNVVDTPVYNQTTPDASEPGHPVRVYKYIRLTNFGELFYRACVK